MTVLWGRQTVVWGDGIAYLEALAAGEVDLVLTSPPYNIGVNYDCYNDEVPREIYREFLRRFFAASRHALREEGSLFLVVGPQTKNPFLLADVIQIGLEYFQLQNQICWVKSISIQDHTYGHFKPIQSRRYLNNNFELIFHFSPHGNAPLDRLAIGVPFMDKSNLGRGTRGKHGDIRCAGNTWFIKYPTVKSKVEKGDHPAIFPEELAWRVLRLIQASEETVVCDPFLGTGTTLVACARVGCRGIGVEISRNYWGKAVARLKEVSVSEETLTERREWIW